MKKLTFFTILPLFAHLNAQVGINTPNPEAALHVKSQSANSANKALQIQNNNTSNANNLEVYEDSRTYIGRPDNSVPNTANDALLNMYGTTTRSNLKLINPPSTQDKSNGNTRSGVNYDKLSPAYIDSNGNIVKAFDPSSPSSLSFDGTYSVPNSATGVKITDIPANGVAIFKVYSGLTLGPAGIGANLLATISFGVNSGFLISDFSSGSGSGATRYPAEYSITDNGSTNIQSYTTSATFTFGTGSSNTHLIFFYQGGSIYARVSEGNPTNIQVFESKRFR